MLKFVFFVWALLVDGATHGVSSTHQHYPRLPRREVFRPGRIKVPTYYIRVEGDGFKTAVLGGEACPRSGISTCHGAPNLRELQCHDQAGFEMGQLFLAPRGVASRRCTSFQAPFSSALVLAFVTVFGRCALQCDGA